MTLTKEEAKHLIDMLKRCIDKKEFNFPTKKSSISFDVSGDNTSDIFTINISRKGIRRSGCTYQGRLKSNNTVLMRLDVNPTSVHIQPGTHEKITGTHLHIYSEEYGDKFAIPFNTKDQDLYNLCFTFFEKFNIIRSPRIKYQEELDI